MEPFFMASKHHLPHNMSLLCPQNKHVTKFIWETINYYDQYDMPSGL